MNFSAILKSQISVVLMHGVTCKVYNLHMSNKFGALTMKCPILIIIEKVYFDLLTDIGLPKCT